jgi:H+/Cl- antiporter ClcA
MPVTKAFAQHRAYWRLLARSVLVGAAGALTTALFLFSEHLLHDLIWSARRPSAGSFDTPPVAAVIVVVAAAVIGLLRRATGLRPPDPNFLDEMVEGRSPLGHALRLAAIGLVSLIGGASVGPEAATATLGAGVGTGLAERDPDADDRAVADLSFAGISGVFGALLTFPFAAPVIALEVQRDDRFGSYARLIPGLVAAATALAILFPFIGSPFLRVYDLGEPPLRSWHLLAGVGLGVIGATAGVITAFAVGGIAWLAQRLRAPVIRALVGGLAIAALGLALPLTLFSGREELAVILDGGQRIAVGLVAATLAGKVLAFAVSMRFGYFGGAIFPLLFIGAVTGVLVNVALPVVPAALAVTAVAAATTVTLVPLPLSVLIVITLLFGLPAELSAVPAVAIVTAYVIVHGTGLLARFTRATAA